MFTFGAQNIDLNYHDEDIGYPARERYSDHSSFKFDGYHIAYAEVHERYQYLEVHCFHC